MLNIVLYGNDEVIKDIIKQVIRNFLYTIEDHYKVWEFDGKCVNIGDKINRLGGNKIYLLDVDVLEVSGLEVARMIRRGGDYDSQILLLSSKKPETLVKKLKNLLYLNVISKDNNLVRELFLGLNEAYRIFARYDVYTFSIFDELYRLPLNDIYYVAKNINDDTVTVYTKDDTYQNYITLKGIALELMRDPRFFKSHRSCVINLNNVASYDRKNNNIVFKNGMKTDLIARSKKSELIGRLKEFDCLVR